MSIIGRLRSYWTRRSHMVRDNDEVHFGVIGCGGMATEVHVPNMAAIDGASTVAYCDVDIAKAGQLLERYGGNYVTTQADEIFADPQIQAVLIQVGPSLHPQL